MATEDLVAQAISAAKRAVKAAPGTRRFIPGTETASVAGVVGVVDGAGFVFASLSPEGVDAVRKGREPDLSALISGLLAACAKVDGDAGGAVYFEAGQHGIWFVPVLNIPPAIVRAVALEKTRGRKQRR